MIISRILVCPRDLSCVPCLSMAWKTNFALFGYFEKVRYFVIHTHFFANIWYISFQMYSIVDFSCLTWGMCFIRISVKKHQIRRAMWPKNTFVYLSLFCRIFSVPLCRDDRDLITAPVPLVFAPVPLAFTPVSLAFGPRGASVHSRWARRPPRDACQGSATARAKWTNFCYGFFQ